MKKLILALMLFSNCASAEEWVVYCGPVNYILKSSEEFKYVMHGYPTDIYTCTAHSEVGEVFTYKIIHTRNDTNPPVWGNNE